nr:hypothetical protein [Tanacetum cinerariifolium]
MYDGIMFTQAPKSAKVSKGLEFPNLQGTVRDRSIGLGPGRWVWEIVLRFLRLSPPKVASEQDELPSSVGLDSRARSDDGQMYSGNLKLTTGRLVNGSSCGGSDMIIKDLDLEPKDIVAKFYGPFRSKELSKKTSSKILPCGDGSCWNMFKPIASLIANGKLT